MNVVLKKEYTDTGELEFPKHFLMEGHVNLKKNQDYLLQYVDPESGYGLLCSQKNNDYLVLNPVATVLWNIPSNFVDPSREARLFAEIFKVPGAAEYMTNIISDMHKRELLLPPDEKSEVAKDYSEKISDKYYALDQIYFYTTMECNARCYHCYQPTIKTENNAERLKDDRVSTEAFLEFVKKALPLGLNRVKISGGEPLLRTDLADIIKGIRKNGLTVAIETNGFLIDEAVADMFAEQNVDVSISLDGGSATVHDTLRGLPGSFERATKAIKMLSDRGCNPKVIMSVSRKNVDEVENTLRIVAENGCHTVKINPINPMGLAQRLRDSGILLTVGELISLKESWKKLESKFGIGLFIDLPPSFSSLPEIYNDCIAVCRINNILGVLPDGSLSFCGIGASHPDLVIGRIDDSDFDIQMFWRENSNLVRVRQLLSGKLEGVCNQCIFESSCKGYCRALAYEESRSFLSPHPWCQSAFENGVFPIYYLNSDKGGEK